MKVPKYCSHQHPTHPPQPRPPHKPTTTHTQVYLRKLGGATVKVKDLGPVTKVGSARRLGALAAESDTWQYEPPAPAATAAATAEGGAGAAGEEDEGLEGRVFYAKRKKAGGKGAAAGGSGAPAAATS
jgi:hypothetical protein